MMKSFFRGLRCIFDTDNEKEPEIQIGAPTDVKHVAHIGCDGPSTPAPSWMNEYQGGSEQSGEKGGASGSSSHAHKSKQNRRSTHDNESSSAHHRPRKNKSSTSESAAGENSRTRRIKNSLTGQDSSPAQETTAKKTRKKKGDGATRSSKAKNKDPSDSTFSDSGCSDGVCRKPQD